MDREDAIDMRLKIGHLYEIVRELQDKVKFLDSRLSDLQELNEINTQTTALKMKSFEEEINKIRKEANNEHQISGKDKRH